MKNLKTSILILVIIWIVSCTHETLNLNEIEGPMVLSLDPNVTIKEWNYISPDQQTETNFTFASDNNGTEFGTENQKVLIIWNEKGFDLYWQEFPCAIKPVLVIKEAGVIEFFAGKQPDSPIVCNAISALHTLSVSLEMDTSLSSDNKWTYHFYPSTP